jgi:lysyl-tRNA synthetase class 2
VIDVDNFTLDGHAMRPARQAVNRTKNFGITIQIAREGDLDPTLRRALIGIADRHRGTAPERGFSMALDRLLSGEDHDCAIVVARDRNGTPIAFQRYVPCKAGAGLSLDTMRRDPVGPNGVNERMIADTVAWAREHEIREVSLNFAAFKAFIEAEAELGPIQTAQAWMIKQLNPYFQIESLLVFNSRFRPRWVPRYLVYRTAPDLPRVIVASLSAESFLPFDRTRRERGDLAATQADEPETAPEPTGHTPKAHTERSGRRDPRLNIRNVAFAVGIVQLTPFITLRRRLN